MTAHPSRRRLALPSMATMIPLLLVLFTGTASAASAVLGIDFGSSYIKAAIVKPGTPLDIVPTKDSKRKEASVVGFKPIPGGVLELGSFPERLYGGDALALGGRFPGDVYTNLKSLLGLNEDEEGTAMIKQYKERHPAISINPALDKGTILFQSPAFNPSEQPWTLDELLAMEFKNIRSNAEAMTGKGSQVTDAVITIPVFYTADEKRAIERAADLAGISILGLVSDGLAVGIDYAVKRTFDVKKPEYHLIFDMGASSTTATILRFQGKEVKDVGRFNKTVQEVAVLGAGWDRTLGGDALNSLIADYLFDEFTKKSAVTSAGITAEEIRNHGRTSSKVWKEAERARQVLSANSDVHSSFEGFYKDIDFKTKLSRADFETLAAPFADRVELPVKQALEAAKLTLKDLDSLILHGGAMRTPFVQKKLEALTGKDTEVRTNVNADESAAHGAAFKAAGLSPSFRVKEIRDSDAAIYAAGITYLAGDKQRQQKLFVPTSQVGPTKQFTVKNLEDFEFGLYQTVGSVDRSVATVKTENLTASVGALSEKFGCTKDDISTAFNFRLSPIDGVPEVVSGTVSCEAEGNGKAGGLGDSVKGLFGFGSKKGEQEALNEGEDAPTETVEAASSSSTNAKDSKASSKAEADSKKKHTEVINIKLTTTPNGLPQPSKAEMQQMKDRLAAFDRSDKARVQREEALNVLEAFTYRARDLLSDAGFESASTEEARSEISSLLSSTSDWLYDEGASAPAGTFKSKLADLKALVEPVQKRIAEAAGRPDKVKLLEGSLEQTKSLIDSIAEQVASAASSASEAVLSSTPVPSSSTPVDDLDDLEEPETSTSETAKPSKAADFVPYTSEDVTSLTETYDSVVEWLKEKTTAQEKLSPYDDPVVTVKDIEAKAGELSKAIQDMLRKKMAGPKSSSSSKKAKPTKSKKGKKSSETASTESETTPTPAQSNAANGGKAKFVSVGPGDEMPSEEEILQMIKDSKDQRADEEIAHEEL
ncbi:stress protein ORP150 [Delphinella strobiligena]|nr:stress protein ORP150 [Delphinella strobiligena]